MKERYKCDNIIGPIDKIMDKARAEMKICDVLADKVTNLGKELMNLKELLGKKT